MATVKTTRMDAQGRVIIPPHIRNELNLYAGQLLNVSMEAGAIQIRPAEERCSICGESLVGDNHTEVTIGTQKKNICSSCTLAILLKAQL